MVNEDDELVAWYVAWLASVKLLMVRFSHMDEKTRIHCHHQFFEYLLTAAESQLPDTLKEVHKNVVAQGTYATIIWEAFNMAGKTDQYFKSVGKHLRNALTELKLSAVLVHTIDIYLSYHIIHFGRSRQW